MIKSHRSARITRAIPVCLALVLLTAHADEKRVYQTDQYGKKQHQAHAIKNDKIYATDKYGNKQQQIAVIKGQKIYQTDKYGNIQHHMPTLIAK